jgi:hypothetical protein
MLPMASVLSSRSVDLAMIDITELGNLELSKQNSCVLFSNEDILQTVHVTN